MEVSKIKLTCPMCKKPFAVVKPAKPGTYKVMCPNAECAREIKLVLRPQELKMGEGNPKPQQPAPQPAAAKPEAQPAAAKPEAQPAADKPAGQPAADIRNVGTPEKTEKGIYMLKTPLRIAEKAVFTCPGCGKKILLAPKTVGAMAVSCPACSTRTAFRAVDKDPQPAKEGVPPAITRRNNPDLNAIKDQKVMVVWGSMYHPHKVELKEGINWVGRNEPTSPADVMIDDKYASARSFYIEKDSQKGICKLYVDHTTNPVTVDGVECKEGNSVYLHFGAKIKTGQTILVLAKSK